MVKDDRVKLSWINKAHEIVDHFSDYFEHPLCDGEALGTLSAQIIEHMHSYVDKAMKKSAYWIKDTTSTECAKKQHKAMLQINSFSVKGRLHFSFALILTLVSRQSNFFIIQGVGGMLFIHCQGSMWFFLSF